MYNIRDLDGELIARNVPNQELAAKIVGCSVVTIQKRLSTPINKYTEVKDEKYRFNIEIVNLGVSNEH